MLKWIAGTLVGVPIVMAQTVAKCMADVFRTILLPVAMVLTVVAVMVAPGSDAAHDAIRNAALAVAAWIAAEGVLSVSTVALRWLDAERTAI